VGKEPVDECARYRLDYPIHSNPKERGWRGFFKDVCHRMHIADSIAELAEIMFDKMREERPGFNHLELAVFAVYYCAITYANDSRRLEDFTMEVGSGKIIRIGKLEDYYPTWMVSRSSLIASQLPRYCSCLDMSRRHLSRLVLIAENIPEDSYALNSCELPTLSAALVYLYSQRIGLRFPVQTISKIHGVSPNSITACMRKLRGDDRVLEWITSAIARIALETSV
jgi:hypothetical protein